MAKKTLSEQFEEVVAAGKRAPGGTGRVTRSSRARAMAAALVPMAAAAPPVAAAPPPPAPVAAPPPAAPHVPAAAPAPAPPPPAPSAPAAAAGPDRFAGIPAEIRAQILAQELGPDPHGGDPRRYALTQLPRPSALFALSKQYRDEAISIFTKTNRFAVVCTSNSYDYSGIRDGIDNGELDAATLRAPAAAAAAGKKRKRTEEEQEQDFLETARPIKRRAEDGALDWDRAGTEHGEYGFDEIAASAGRLHLPEDVGWLESDSVCFRDIYIDVEEIKTSTDDGLGHQTLMSKGYGLLLRVRPGTGLEMVSGPHEDHELDDLWDSEYEFEDEHDEDQFGTMEKAREVYEIVMEAAKAHEAREIAKHGSFAGFTLSALKEIAANFAVRPGPALSKRLKAEADAALSLRLIKRPEPEDDGAGGDEGDEPVEGEPMDEDEDGDDEDEDEDEEEEEEEEDDA